MKFGVREICDVVFKAKADTKIGNSTFKKGQPVLYIDSAKTSTIEGAATTVYAQGGKGNTRLIAWEGEKTLTFTVEDALLSPIGFSVLSGAGLFKDDSKEVHVHTTANSNISTSGEIDLTDTLGTNEKIDGTAPVFVMIAEADGSITGQLVNDLTVSEDGKKLIGGTVTESSPVFVDFYVVKPSSVVSELQIDAANFAGSYYVEASTLFRRESDGVDMPAEITLPNVKIQSNFTFSMASSGDPSTFTFTMDAFPGYTMFDNTKKVLCVIQTVEDASAGSEIRKSVMGHPTGFDIEENDYDSTDMGGESDQTAEENGIPESKKNSNVEMLAPTTNILGKNVSDLISEDTYVSTSGAVNGTLKHVTGYTDFSSNVAEQEGNYFPFKLKNVQGEKMTIKKNGTARADKTDIQFDPELIFRVERNSDRFAVEVDGKQVIELNFKNAKLEK